MNFREATISEVKPILQKIYKQETFNEFESDTITYDGHAFVYERQGETIAGFTVYKNIGIPWYLGLGYFYVIPEYRKQGLGSKIVEEVCKEYQGLGIVINSIIDPAFYARYSFKILGLKNERDNAIMMVRHPNNILCELDENLIFKTVAYI